jgi:aspartate-semialdehyde dehydrogenase
LFLIKRVDVSSYHSVSGTGKDGIDELIEQTKKFLNDEDIHPKVYGAQIAFNVIPAGNILESNYTDEEIKMSFETNKILDKDIKLSATCSRVPVLYGHSLSVHVETEKEINLDLLIQKIKGQKGLDFFDSQDFTSPNAVNHAEGKNPVSVGRVRLDLWDKNRVNFWVVADNLRKGAALNSLQILDELL